MTLHEETPARTADRLAAGRWALDVDGSTAEFRARDFLRREVVGTIPLVDGHVDVGPGGRPAAVSAALDVTGLATGIDRRDRDLRGRHFLHSASFPTLAFASSQVEPGDGGGWTVRGTLLVRDVPCAVCLAVRLEHLGDGDAVVVATAEIDRRDAGVRAAPGFVVGHRVGIRVRARLRTPVAA